MQTTNYDKLMTRLTLILSKLSEDSRPTIKDLADEFNVSVRTIQTDIYRRLTYFPIEKKANGELRFIRGFSLHKTFLEQDEMLYLTLAMEGMEVQGKRYRLIREKILKKLLTPTFHSAYWRMPEHVQAIDLDSPLIKTIQKSIEAHRIVELTIKGNKIRYEPYRIANIAGIWYLLVRHTELKKIQYILLSSIKEVMQMNTFVPLENIQSILDNTHSEWFEEGAGFEVTILVKEEVAHYFKERKFLSSQSIDKENEDGSIIVSFRVTHDDDVDNLIKSWLPHVYILTPVRFKNKILDELQLYLEGAREVG